MIGKPILVVFTINLVQIRKHVGFREVGKLQGLVDFENELRKVLLNEAFLNITVLGDKLHVKVESTLRLGDEDYVCVDIERYGTSHPLKVMAQKFVNLDLFTLIFEVLVPIVVAQNEHLEVYEFESVYHLDRINLVA